MPRRLLPRPAREVGKRGQILLVFGLVWVGLGVGILTEGDHVLSEYEGTSALDAGLISSAQAVEHYEITRYGTLRRWAKMLALPGRLRPVERDS